MPPLATVAVHSWVAADDVLNEVAALQAWLAHDVDDLGCEEADDLQLLAQPSDVADDVDWMVLR
jgi:hypothetical protein